MNFFFFLHINMPIDSVIVLVLFMKPFVGKSVLQSTSVYSGPFDMHLTSKWKLSAAR